MNLAALLIGVKNGTLILTQKLLMISIHKYKFTSMLKKERKKFQKKHINWINNYKNLEKILIQMKKKFLKSDKELSCIRNISHLISLKEIH
jgi:hypothetical protein